jgi:hypothetical protein
MLARGFLPEHVALYDFRRWQPCQYLTAWEVESRLDGLDTGPGRAILDDKERTHEAFQRAGAGDLLPPWLGRVEDGVFVPRPGGPGSLAEALTAYPRLFLKPRNGSQGSGARVVSATVDVPDTGDYLVEGCLEQHPTLREIYPRAVNTLRVLTVRHPTAGLFVARMAQRIGTDLSAPTDNYSRRGLVAGVRDGVLLDAVTRPGPHGVARLTHHPDTGARIEGVALPFPELIEDLMLRAAAVVPDVVHVGWDVALTSDGPVLLEGNAGIANPNVFQAHRPLLDDPRLIGFYERHGVISTRKARSAAALLPAPR